MGIVWLVVLVVCCACASAGAAQAAGRARPWEPFELELTAEGEFANTYVETLPEGGKPYVLVTFVGMDGEAQGMRYIVPGFWDGGRTWKVRFAPPAAGTWSYLTASDDRGLDGVKGTLECQEWTDEEKAANPTRRGPIRVARSGRRAGRHFEYADGTPFLWIGDTWWPWARRGIPWERAKQVIDDRAARGFTVGQIVFGANAGVDLAGRDRSTPDFEAIHNAERFIAYANSKGITLWVMPWWSAPDLPRTGAEKIRRWTRYMVHRLAAYNVIWNVAGEYNMHDYGGMGLQFWKDMGALIRAEDPYGRAIGVHNTPPFWAAGEMGESAQWSTGEVLHREPWLDFNGSQVGHGKWRNELIPAIIAADYARMPPKPTLITEPWYEFVEGSAPAMDVRFAAWSAFLSGAAGHTYGGGHQWWAVIPDPSRTPPRLDPWPTAPLTVDTLDFPGAASIGFMATFLRGIAWWELEPHPELVLEYAQPLAAAVPGKEYLVYARYGGGLKLDLRSCPSSDQFRFAWIDPADGREAMSGTVNGGGVRAFHAPDDYPGALHYRDWLLHVRKAD